MIYLASPYSHPDPVVRRGRAALAAKAASVLTEHTSHAMVYSPIVHGHAMNEHRALPLGWEFWRPRCRAAVELSTEVALLFLDRWWDSVGMATEYQWALEMKKPVRSYLLQLSPRSRLIETVGPPRFNVEARP